MKNAKKKEISFDISKEDMALVKEIVSRAWPKVTHVYSEIMDLRMDIIATHCNGNPLRLKEMLKADDFNFFHDIYGIAKHLNRTTGELTGLFSPRFSA